MKMKEFLKKMYKLYKPFRFAALALFLFLMVGETLHLVNPYIYGMIIDKIVSRGPMAEVVKLLILAFCLYVSNAVVLSYIRERLEIKKFDYDVAGHVAEKTFGRMMKFSIGQHMNENSGIKKSVIDKGQHSLSSLLFTLIYEALPTVIQVLVSVIALLIIAPPIGAIVLVGALIFAAVSISANFIIKKQIEKINYLHDENSKLSNEILRNMDLIKINAREEKTTEEYMDNLNKFFGLAKKTWLRFILFAYCRNLFMEIARFLAMFVGIWYVYKGVYTPGYLVIFLSWSSNAFGKLFMLSFLHRRLTEMYAAIKKYFILMNVEPDVKQVENPVTLRQVHGSIEVKDLNFKYPNRQYIEDEKEKGKFQGREDFKLTNINLSIEPGRTVAIVGPSGSGKSTLVQLLIRAFDPDSGRILIDGHDLREIDLKKLREAIGMVSQDVSLFDNTLRYNVVFGLNGFGHKVTDHELDKVSKLSCIDGFYHRLEKGFDTIIGEKGIKLSGGERQRVGIARALIKTPYVLIFDEATSHLDTENEAMIRQSIKQAARGRTTIIIAHRLSTIKDADKIVVMNEGRVVGQGRHDELMETCETYQRLINNQTVMVG